MKITHLIAAATMIAGLGVSTAASAQDWRHERREVRGWHDNGRHHGWGHRSRCHTEYRHHHRVTVCRR